MKPFNYLKQITRVASAIAASALLAVATPATAQISVSANKTAALLASTLAGTGVTIISPTLTCNGAANGTYTTGATDPVGIPLGIVLASGAVVDTLGYNGLANPASTFASAGFGFPGDPDLTTLADGTATLDACVLEFDFKAAGDTIKFNYVFGSEEYPEYACTDYNDVFGFLISGGAYATPTNIALIPGTTIPVCINSVNAGPGTAGGVLSTCTALGPGSPFTTYYVDNSASTLLVYNGLTTVFAAIAAVNPCDTYHLKLGVADKGDDGFDSGVFLEGGSLSSTISTSITAAGTSGLPYCIRGCAPGNFVFSTPTAQDTPVVIHYIITGSAVNGYDYSTIPDSVTIAPFTTSTILNINTLTVPPAGPKVVTLEILVPDPCHPGVSTVGTEANLTILDSFSFHIVTPDTAICSGQHVNIVAVGDSIFADILHYTWSPATTLSTTTGLTPTATPTVTTTYTLTGYTDAALGCASKSHNITITISDPTLDSVTGISPTVCGYTNGSITLWGLQTGLADTLFYTLGGVAAAGVPVTVTPAHTATISGLGAGTYTNIYVKVGQCFTPVKGPVTLLNPPPPVVTVDSPLVKTCVGVAVQLHAYVTPAGIPYSYSWSPATYLSSAVIANPVVDPLAAGNTTYTVTVNPATNPACAATATLTVHTVPNDFTLFNHDTAICIGQSVNVSISGSGEFTWAWAPPAGVSDVTSMTPVITPTATTTYTVTASYAHCPDMVHSFNIEVDYPAPTNVITDTICLTMTYAVDVTVPGSTGTGTGYYHYQWTPPGDFSNDTIPNPVITPATTGLHSYTVTIQPHAAACAITDIVNLQVYPDTINLVTPDTAICYGNSVHINASGDPVFAYSWLPTAGVSGITVVAPLITPDTSAMYVVTASFHKCPDIKDSLYIDVQPNPSLYVGGRTTVCEDDTLHLQALATPQWYSHYSYSWSSASGHIDVPTANAIVYTGSVSASVVVTVATPAGCSAVDSAMITVYPRNRDSLQPRTDFCPHESDTLHPLGNSVSYAWSPAMYLSDSSARNPVLSPETSQAYSVIATDANGCRDTMFFSVTVHPSAILYLPDSVTLYPGETYQISPETNCSNFFWSPAGGLSSPYISNPQASPAISTQYIVRASTEYGCKTTDTLLIHVADESVIDLPNAFTPGNSVNNEFKIIKRGIATLNYFRIFNRWGNLVFDSKDIDKGWNGEFKGVPQAYDVYVYQVEAVTSTGKVINKQGNVTLIR